MMLVPIAGIEPESIVDGEGIRYAIFMQGCMRRCKGCHNPSAQSLLGGKLMWVNDIIQDWKNYPLINGITLTGGEPFLHAGAVEELARAAKEKGLSVWCYTGYRFEELGQAFLENIDVLVDGEYIEEQRDLELKFRGSSNQRIIDVQPTLKLGKLTYWRESL